jgi:hypothetical protein
MRLIGLCLLAFGVATLFGSGWTNEDLEHAGSACLRSAAGSGNGLCCIVEGGAYCFDSWNIRCQAPLPYECDCTCPGSACNKVVQHAKKHDLCVEPSDPIPEANCTTVDTFCFLSQPGTCDSDGGPWSWLGFCFTCGCVPKDDAETELQLTRRVCAAGSTGC